MALMKASEVPKDAVQLTEIEAMGYAWDLVKNWDKLSDTWALRFGPAMLGGLCSLTGILVNRHYRWRLKLGSYAYLPSVIPIAIMPGLLNSGFHRYSVTMSMLMMSKDCPVCYEVKAAVMQMFFGVVYPMVLGPTSALMFANRYATYRVPQLREGPKVMFQFLRKHTSTFKGTLTNLVIAQLIASAAITYFEMKNNITMRKKLLEIERRALAKENSMRH